MRRGVKPLVALACGTAAVTVAGAFASTEARRSPRVKTLVATKGQISGFAQDDDWIAWADSSLRCDRGIQLRNLRTRKTRRLLTVCRSHDKTNWVDEMVLAGRRVLWSQVYPSGNTQCGLSVLTTAPGERGRRVGGINRLGFRLDDACAPVPMAGDGSTLVFADNSNEEGARQTGVSRVGKRVQFVPGTEGTNAVAVSEGIFALVRRGVVEGRTWSTGNVVWSFPGFANELALDGERIALFITDVNEGGAVISERVEVRTTTGALLRSFAVPKTTSPEIGISGRWLLYRTGNTIRVADVGSGASSVLAKARGTAGVGLSVEGRRVAWAERRRGMDVIRALVLPQ